MVAGFIVGFDSEGWHYQFDRSADRGSAIQICMIGLLTALPDTQLARRLKPEGRLFVDYELFFSDDGDQCTQGLNFTTLRPRRAVFKDARRN